jgi:hypothetical protein
VECWKEAGGMCRPTRRPLGSHRDSPASMRAWRPERYGGQAVRISQSCTKLGTLFFNCRRTSSVRCCLEEVRPWRAGALTIG